MVVTYAVYYNVYCLPTSLNTKWWIMMPKLSLLTMSTASPRLYVLNGGYLRQNIASISAHHVYCLPTSQRAKWWIITPKTRSFMLLSICALVPCNPRTDSALIIRVYATHLKTVRLTYALIGKLTFFVRWRFLLQLTHLL